MRTDSNIVDYWRAIELLTPPPIGDPNTYGPGGKEAPVRDLSARSQTLWKQDGWPANPPRRDGDNANRKWVYTVYVGVFDLDRLYRLWAENIDPKAQWETREFEGQSALASFRFDQDGDLVPDSAVMSTTAWATGVLIRNGAGSLARSADNTSSKQFERQILQMFTPKNLAAVERTFISAVVGASGGDPTVTKLASFYEAAREHFEATRPTTYLLTRFGKDLAKQLGVESLVREDSCVRVRADDLFENADESRYKHDFLNSLIATDLARVAGAVRDGKAGRALTQFLSGTDSVHIDDRTDLDEASQALDRQQPKRMPAAKWPSPINQPLYPRQQIAVNEIVDTLGHSSGLIGVNGPPGTGKTTLLRDLVAHVVTERAAKLAGLTKPSNAFVPLPGAEGDEPPRIDGFQFDGYKVHKWQPGWDDFGIVVATTFNAAAQNISAEIPQFSSIKGWEHEAKELDYFAEIADNLRADKKKKEGEQTEPSWGTLATVLGKGKYRKNVADEVAGHFYKPAGICKILQETTKADCPDWKEVCEDFRRAKKQVDDIIQERQRYHEDLIAFWSQAAEARAAAKQAKEDLTTARQKATQAKRLRSEEKTANEASKHARHQVSLWKPSEILVAFRASRQQRQMKRHFDRAVKDARAAVARVGRLKQLREKQLDLASFNDEGARNLRDKLEGMGLSFPDQAWRDARPEDRDMRELGSLWTDPILTELRTRLFLKALAVHKAFVVHNRASIKTHLLEVAKALRGEPYGSEEALRHSWASWFLVAPVVSTTFASLDRVFPAHDAESLGWVLVDEAGQATPQGPAGAIWRAKRAVLVGDPDQLEPIVTLPDPVRRLLCRPYGVDLGFADKSLSAQRLADNVTKVGSYIDAKTKQRWTGLPLLVHSRCDRPMFEAANEISYGGRMVYATKPKEFPEAAPKSQWFHVPAGDHDGHWIPQEGVKVKELLARLGECDVKQKDIMLLTPFVKVADELRKLKGDGSKFAAVGTVHASQGGEADVVIFVLGGDPDEWHSKRFATDKDNLLNVAITRAKQRLYVVGNKDGWLDRGQFGTLEDNLRKWQ